MNKELYQGPRHIIAEQLRVNLYQKYETEGMDSCDYRSLLNAIHDFKLTNKLNYTGLVKIYKRLGVPMGKITLDGSEF